MIYLYRTLWVIGYIPVFLMECLTFLIGFLTFPIVVGVYYVKHGSTIGLKWEVDTIPIYTDKKYRKLKDLIEKQK